MSIKNKLGLLALTVFTVLAVTLGGVHTVQAAESDSAMLRKIIQNEKNLSAEYPLVYNLFGKKVEEKINNDIDGYVQKAFKAMAKSNAGANLNYTVYKNADGVLSLVLQITAAASSTDTITQGLNYDLQTGERIPLAHYFARDALISRARDGLSYVYSVQPEEKALLTENYYVDTDDNVIAIYNAKNLGQQERSELEVNLTAAEEAAPVPPQTAEKALLKATITGDDVRVRAQPGLSSAVLTYVNKGAKVTAGTITEADGLTWRYVKLENGTGGWVAAQYCQEVK